MKKIIFLFIAVLYSNSVFPNENASNIVGFKISKYISNKTNLCFSFSLPIGEELKPEGCVSKIVDKSDIDFSVTEKEWIDKVEIEFNSKIIKIIVPNNVNNIVIPFLVTHAHLQSGGQYCALIDIYDNITPPRVQFKQCNNVTPWSI